MNSIAIPILIGITGHRDIPPEDVAPLKAAIASVLADLKARCPNTPIHLLSPLAEGADRIAAEAGLASGVRLIVPLPLPQADYEMDFANPASIDDFRRLMGRADFVVELPLADGSTPESIREYGPARDKQYLAVGRFIVEHCQALVALWDGTVNNKVGGTADIVARQLTGKGVGSEEFAILDADLLDPVQTGPVFHIVTCRINPEKEFAPDVALLDRHLPAGRKPSLEPFSRNDLAPADEASGVRAVTRGVFECIDAFNSDAKGLPEGDVRQSKEWLLSKPNLEALSPSLSSLADVYSTADALAIVHQKRVLSTLEGIAVLIPVIVLFFELYTGVAPWLAFLLAYTAALGVAYLFHRRAARGGWHERFLDDRALAEGLRVQFFWRLAGLPDSAVSHYLDKQRSELDWIRHAMRNVGFVSSGAIRRGEITRTDIAAVLGDWVGGQAKYFRKTAIREQSKNDRIERVSNRLVGIATFGVLPAMLAVHWSPLSGGWVDVALQTLIPMLFVVAGALRYYADKMLLAPHAQQYARMAAFFGKAGDMLKGLAEDDPRVRRILFQVGREALAENGDWLMMHRERPIEVPKG